MKSKLFKAILSLAMAVCMLVPVSAVCFADEYDETQAVATVSTQGNDEDNMNETASPLSVTRSGVIYGPLYGTTSGFVAGKFEVPYNTTVNAHWKSTPMNGANSSAVFKLTVTGNGITKTVYLDTTDTMKSYAIGYLGQGEYQYTITPYTNVSGEYFYGIQFYAY